MSKIVKIFKSTSDNKVKYFTEFLANSFHIKSSGNAMSFGMEACKAFEDNETYYYVEELTLEDCGKLIGKFESFNSITPCKLLEIENPDLNGPAILKFYKDENGIVHKIGHQIAIETSTQAHFNEIKPTVKNAVDLRASNRKVRVNNQEKTSSPQLGFFGVQQESEKKAAKDDIKVHFKVKTTFINSGKVKYFNDFLEAAFHIESCGVSPAEFKVETFPAYFDGTSYLALDKIADVYKTKLKKEYKFEFNVDKILPNTPYPAKQITGYYDGGGAGFGGGERGPDRIYTDMTKKGDRCDEYERDPIKICKDESGTIYQIGNAIPLLEKAAPEYERIRLAVDDAVYKAQNRKNAEFNQAKTNYEQGQQELLRLQQEFEKQKAVLEGSLEGNLYNSYKF